MLEKSDIISVLFYAVKVKHQVHKYITRNSDVILEFCKVLIRIHNKIKQEII